MELYRGKSKKTGSWIIGTVVCMGNRAFALVSPNLEPERPAYNGMAMGCGLEDKGLTEKAYLAMEYGWEDFGAVRGRFPYLGRIRAGNGHQML